LRDFFTNIFLKNTKEHYSPALSVLSSLEVSVLAGPAASSFGVSAGCGCASACGS
jgi:hypothetical protein